MSKNKKIILIILSIFIVLGLFLGVSYAYYIKSINQLTNKKNAYLKSILDKTGQKNSKRLNSFWYKRNNQIDDYLNKSAKFIINYLINNNIGTLVIGYNFEFKQNVNIGKANNQNFVNLPISKLKNKWLCHSK